METLQGVWKQHLRPRAVVGYGVKIFLPSPPQITSPDHLDSLVINAVLMNLDKESLTKMELKIMYFRVLCLKNVNAQKLN